MRCWNQNEANCMQDINLTNFLATPSVTQGILLALLSRTHSQQCSRDDGVLKVEPRIGCMQDKLPYQLYKLSSFQPSNNFFSRLCQIERCDLMHLPCINKTVRWMPGTVSIWFTSTAQCSHRVCYLQHNTSIYVSTTSRYVELETIITK